MSQEERVETLPSIIKSLAQQLATRDAQLKDKQAKFDEELTSARHQEDVMRRERDHALRTAEEGALERTRLKEQVKGTRAELVVDVERAKLEGERDVAREKANLATVKAEFDLERAELRRRIGHLEQAAAHHAETISQIRNEAADWKNRFTEISDELRRRTDEWAAQLSRISRTLEEFSAVRRNINSGSSPTVAPCNDSPPVNISPATKNHFLKDARQSRGIPRSEFDRLIQAQSQPVGVHHPHARGSQNLSSSNLLGDERNGPSPPQRKINGDGNSSPPNLQQKQLNRQAQAKESLILPPANSSSFSVLPPDRVITTVHYKIKREDDEDEDFPYSNEHNYSEASGSRASHSKEDADEPVAKRRRTTVRNKSAKRIIQNDEEDDEEITNQLSDEDHEMRGIEEAFDEDKNDFDEMAIGAEENHKEVYGHRRVNVREVNTDPRTPPHQRSQTRPGTYSGGSSTKKRKRGSAVSTSAGRNPVNGKR